MKRAEINRRVALALAFKGWEPKRLRWNGPTLTVYPGGFGVDAPRSTVRIPAGMSRKRLHALLREFPVIGPPVDGPAVAAVQIDLEDAIALTYTKAQHENPALAA